MGAAIIYKSLVHENETWFSSSLPKLREILRVGDGSSLDIRSECLPFSVNDTTAGAENELQAVVAGAKTDVDFPNFIENSNYYKNLQKRTAAGETTRKPLDALQNFLDNNPDNVWENSWVSFPESVLNPHARNTLYQDLLADKQFPNGPKRSDAHKFFYTKSGNLFIRIPVSYLLKLSLSDALAARHGHPAVASFGVRLMDHFLNDNTSPETFSFYPSPVKRSTGMGDGVALETLKRFFLSQLLIQYANRKFKLSENGQRAMIYFSPHTHTRQKKLNDLISDSFYRELFMSPCLCGWNRGQDKHRYMCLCHKVLSRSQLNAVSKLKESGIITRNLVVLPSLSNVSLANNGTHISLGSRKLTGMLGDEESGFSHGDEKYLGDLVIKIVEHFLPLFVGTYSAAPYRLDFWDFHPEKALGFLPHELDFTHIRMMWRRWKKKANLKILGHPVTPFGPQWFDRLFSRALGLRGDFVNDFRLIDYFVSLMSTERSPALDGRIGNDRRLKQDLSDFGVFDPSMPMYLLYRLREFPVMGFSGFEGRYYSLFEDIIGDMGQAASLQTLITALAYKYILSGQITHEDIPDTPSIESERRQIFFGSAIGIPTFFVRKDTRNQLMNRILKKTEKTRLSHRYRGYIRVHNQEYQKSLIRMIQEDGADLIEMMGLGETIKDLSLRVEDPQAYAVSHRLTNEILESAGARSPLALSSEEFNTAAEKFYRNNLRKRQMQEAIDIVEQDFIALDSYAILKREVYREAMRDILGDEYAWDFLEEARKNLLNEESSEEVLIKLIHLTVLSVYADIKHYEGDAAV